MKTVYTAPNGNADVVNVDGETRLRERRADGTWILYNTLYAFGKACAAADRVDAWVEARRTVALLYS